MPPLDHAVGLGVISGGSEVIDAEDFGELLKQRRLELTSLIRRDVRWHTKTGDPSGYEVAGDCLGGDVGKWIRLWPSGVSVDAGEEISHAIRYRQRSDQIDVYVSEALIWYVERCVR